MTRVGIIGAGRMGARHLAGYQAAGATISGIAGSNESRGRSLAASAGCPWYEDYRDLLKNEKLDVVSVCSPPLFHHEQVLAAIDHGAAVLCEKPMATDVASAQEMVDAAEKAGTVLMLNFPHRHYELTETVRELLARGELGDIISFHVRFAVDYTRDQRSWVFDQDAAGGGVLMDAAVHAVDLFRDVVGEIECVSGNTRSVRSDIALEDTAVLVVTGPEGQIGVIEADWSTPGVNYHWSVNGTTGAATVSYKPATLTTRLAGDEFVTVKQFPDTVNSTRIERTVQHFLNCVAGHVKPRGTGEDGLRSMEVIAAAYEAARQQRTIHLSSMGAHSQQGRQRADLRPGACVPGTRSHVCTTVHESS